MTDTSWSELCSDIFWSESCLPFCQALQDSAVVTWSLGWWQTLKSHHCLVDKSLNVLLRCLKGVDSLSWLPRISILRQSLKAEIQKTYTWLNWEACLGWVFPYFVYLQHISPTFFSSCVSLPFNFPISIGPFILDLVCSTFSQMDTIHIVPSVEAIYEKHFCVPFPYPTSHWTTSYFINTCVYQRTWSENHIYTWQCNNCNIWFQCGLNFYSLICIFLCNVMCGSTGIQLKISQWLLFLV